MRMLRVAARGSRSVRLGFRGLCRNEIREKPEESSASGRLSAGAPSSGCQGSDEPSHGPRTSDPRGSRSRRRHRQESPPRNPRGVTQTRRKWVTPRAPPMAVAELKSGAPSSARTRSLQARLTHLECVAAPGGFIANAVALTGATRSAGAPVGAAGAPIAVGHTDAAAHTPEVARAARVARLRAAPVTGARATDRRARRADSRCRVVAARRVTAPVAQAVLRAHT